MNHSLKDFICQHLKQDPIRVFLFGSRARKTANTHADYDIGYIPKAGFNPQKITTLKEAYENSNFPYKIDFVNFATCDPTFKKEALKDIEIWID